MPITRGFKGRQTETVGARDRVPPGQYVTRDFPVLTAGPTQRTPLESWSLSLQRGGELIARWSWAEFEALPQTERTTDIHCVTKWTKLDTQWRGVTFDDIARQTTENFFRLFHKVPAPYPPRRAGEDKSTPLAGEGRVGAAAA